jgi:hypothetical protein
MQMSMGDLPIAENDIHAVQPVVHEFESYQKWRASAARVLPAIESALAGVGEGSKDGAGVFVHDLTKVHGDGEQEDQKEKVDAKQ